MPAIALINGHCFGAGCFIALAHDYSIQNASKGFWCLPEVDLGMVIPSTIALFLKAKFPSLKVYRDAALEGRRYNGPEALKVGIVDAVGGLDETLKFIDERKLVSKIKPGAFGGLKEDTWREVLAGFADHQGNVDWRNTVESEKLETDKKAEESVVAWEDKSKL